MQKKISLLTLEIQIFIFVEWPFFLNQTVEHLNFQIIFVSQVQGAVWKIYLGHQKTRLCRMFWWFWGIFKKSLGYLKLGATNPRIYVGGYIGIKI